jgi:hypothetical protein
MSIEMYLLKFELGNVGMPGAPILHVSAGVDAPTGAISGQAEITQAVAPPEGSIRINDLRGRIVNFPSGRVIVLRGTYQFSFPPPAIGEGTAAFEAVVLLDAKEWQGEGWFKYGGQEVENVPFTLITESAAEAV